MADRTLVYVKASSRCTWLYGFSTSLDQADRTALGHIDAVVGTTGLVFGVNSPKPARMKKVKADGSTVSSYVDQGSRTSAAQAGWKLIKRAKARIARPSTRVVPVYVELQVGTGSVKYAWNMPKALYDTLAATRSQLGISDASTETDPFDLVWGCSMKPGRAYNPSTGKSTFVGSGITALPTGWLASGGEQE